MNVLALSCKKSQYIRSLLINTQFCSFSNKKEETPKPPGKHKFSKIKPLKTSNQTRKPRANAKSLPLPNQTSVK